jgi:predicted anti-sigma-YlaC factor YlaD
MHREIRHNLEDFLRGEDYLRASVSRLPAEFQAHLGECAECSAELHALEAQSQLLRSLRAPQDLEPRGGFYARVIQRIEAQPASIWSVFLDRKFGLRLAVASAGLVALLGTYLVTSEPSGPEAASSPTVVLTDTPRTTEASLRTEESVQQPEDGPRQQQQRDAVLVDLASYRQ